jgi:hypothetical protein
MEMGSFSWTLEDTNQTKNLKEKNMSWTENEREDMMMGT